MVDKLPIQNVVRLCM